MQLTTRVFGDIDISDDKILTFPKGIIGFPEYTKFALIYDEDDKKSHIKWLQSMDEGELALPVIDPSVVKPDYEVEIAEEYIENIGETNEENTFILTTITVPQEVEKLTVNLKAPIVINTEKAIGGQWIVENDFPVKYPVYDILQKKKNMSGHKMFHYFLQFLLETLFTQKKYLVKNS